MRSADRWLTNYRRVASAQRFDVASVACSIVPADDHNVWHLVYRPPNPTNVVSFEKQVARYPRRQGYNLDSVAEVARTGRTLLGRHAGFCDLFVPVFERDRLRAILVAGPFSARPLTAEALSATWTALTGRHPTLADRQFRRYVCAALDTVVLDGPLLRSFQAFVEGLGSLLGTDESAEEIWQRRVERPIAQLRPYLLMGAVAADLVDRDTHDIALGELREWNGPHLRIRQIPTCALAAFVETRTDDDLAELVVAKEFQRQSVRFALSHPDTLAGSVGDRGVFLLTRCDPERTRRQMRLMLLDLAAELRAFAAASGVVLRIGIADPGPEARSLADSYDQAILAVQWAVHERKPSPVWASDAARDATGTRIGLHARLRALGDAIASGAADSVKIACGHLLREVFSAAAGSRDATRAYLESLLYELLERAAHCPGPRRELLESTEDRFRERLHCATTIFDLPAAFEEAVQRLREIHADPARTDRTDRLELARHIVQHRFAEPLRLAQVARQVGFSRSQFASLFKRHTGTSFGALLSQVRLEHAKKLLSTTSLPVSHVATQAGFRSHRYFSATFRGVAGVSPAAFRRAARCR